VGVTSQRPVRVAVVGAGAIARQHIEAFRDVKGVVLAGIHSRTRARAEALASEFGIPAVCESVPALFDKTGADLVVVAVSIVAMKIVSLCALQFSWTVLLEKPLGTGLIDAEEIAAAAHRGGRSAYVAMNRRFFSSTQSVVRDLSSTDAPRFIHVDDQQDFARAVALGEPPELLATWMYAVSIHLVDAIRVFGRGTVTSVTTPVPWNEQAPGIVVATVEFSSGDVATYHAIWNGPGPWALSITASGQRWEMRPPEALTTQHRGEREPSRVEIHPWDRQFRPGFRLQAEHAVAAARGEPSQSVTIEDALESVRLVSAIYAPVRRAHAGG
jgi:predicted dehydrogenase